MFRKEPDDMTSFSDDSPARCWLAVMDEILPQYVVEGGLDDSAVSVASSLT
jgi:hypothetical protein